MKSSSAERGRDSGFQLVIFFLLFISALFPLKKGRSQMPFRPGSHIRTKPNAQPLALNCNTWLSTPSRTSFVNVGDLDVPGHTITVEAMFNRTAPYSGGNEYAGDLVSKHQDPVNVNYLLRPNSAAITTADGVYHVTPAVCDIELNKTYHVAMTYDGATLKFYRNGFLLSQTSVSGELIQDDYNTQFGTYQANFYNEQLVGYINEVRIWNIVRTQAQIQAGMNNILPTPTTQTGLLAYYNFNDLQNKQGNAARNGTLGGGASINQSNPTCAAFLADNRCCPTFSGTLAGSNICKGEPGLLTFTNTAATGSASYTLVYSDGVVDYTITNVKDGVPFSVQVSPATTTTYNLKSISDGTLCSTAISGQNATINVKNCDFCNSWLSLPSYPSFARIGDLDVPGNQITVEAMFNRIAPYSGGNEYAGDLVSKHRDPNNINYLLRPNSAAITTADGVLHVTPPVCDIELNKTYHVAMVYDGATLKFYRNGFLLSQTAVSGNMYQNDFATQIGLYEANYYNEQLIGFVNEVRIWNVARTQSQLQATMNSVLPSPPTQPGLLAYYSFNNLTNKQGNATWNATLGAPAATGSLNPTCSAFIADNKCCPVFAGTVTGNKICTTELPQLTFHDASVPASGPYTITYTDGTNDYVQNNVTDGIPFNVQGSPVSTTSYTLKSITDPSGCIGKLTGSATIYFANLEAPDFSFVRDACNTLQVTFDAVLTANDSFDWTLDGNTYSSTEHLVHTFTTAGNYAVVLAARDKSGATACTLSVTKTINLTEQAGDVIKTGDTTICSSDTILLRANPANTYCWAPAVLLDHSDSARAKSQPAVSTAYSLKAMIPSTNLVANPGFSQGALNFSTDAIYSTSGTAPGHYYVGTIASSWNPAYSSCGDHSGGPGQMMLYNEQFGSSVKLWYQEFDVTANTDYLFSFWLEELSKQGPARLAFQINGATYQPIQNSSAVNCQWKQSRLTWNSGSAVHVRIALVALTAATSTGNGFAIDDIYFGTYSFLNESVQVTVDKPTVQTSDNINVCPGTLIQLSATGALSYAWSPAATLSAANVAEPIDTAYKTQKFIVTGTDALGCKGKDSVTVTLFHKIAIKHSSDTTICPGIPTSLHASGGSGFGWTPATFLDNPASPDPVATVNSDTRFYVSMTDPNGCAESDSLLLSIRPKPLFQAPEDEIVCKGSAVKLKSINDQSDLYSWSPSTGLDNPASPAPEATPEMTTIYALHISDPVCTAYDSNFSVNVEVKPTPTVRANRSNDIDCAHLSSQLSATGGLNYSWLPAEKLSNALLSNPVAILDSTTTFIVQGLSENGCAGFDTLTVVVKNEGKLPLSMPNAFTPNGDGLNDCYGIKRWGAITLAEFSIYNRWGQRVFTTNKTSDCWDGSFHGEREDTGQFIYILRGSTFCGVFTKTGPFVLIR